MGHQRVEITTAGAARAAVVAAADADPVCLVVPIGDAVPDWLAEVVDLVRSSDDELLVRLEPPSGLDAESVAGWEIGVLTVVLGLGITSIEGADPHRRHRVEAVLAALATAASASAEVVS